MTSSLHRIHRSEQAAGNPLPKDGTVRRYLEVTAPTEPGTYYYGVCVDAVNNESDTDNNCYMSAVPVTVTLGPAGLEVPPGLISQVAFSSDFTYFMFVAQFPEITSVADTEVIYDKCTITLDIPGVPGSPVRESDKYNPRLDNPSYLMFQINTTRQQLKQAGRDRANSSGCCQSGGYNRCWSRYWSRFRRCGCPPRCSHRFCSWHRNGDR